MGSRSSSANSTTNNIRETTFNNVDYGGDSAGSGSALAKNINLAESTLEVGQVQQTNIASDHGAVLAGRDVALKSLEISQANTNRIQDSADLALTRAYSDVEASRELSGQLAFGSLNAVQDTTRYALQYGADQVSQALAAAKTLSKSESAQVAEMSQKMTLGLMAVSALGLVMAMRGKR